MKKKYSALAIVLISATIFLPKEEILASTIQWETAPTEGTTIYEPDNIVRIRPDFQPPSPEKNIYGAGFFTEEGGYLGVELSILLSNSFNFYDLNGPRFMITTSSLDFFWNEEDSQKTIFDSWRIYSFGQFTNFQYFTHTTLKPQTYLSFILEAREIRYAYRGLGEFNFIANATTPAPVPEPSTMLLFGAGLTGLAVLGRNRNNKK